MYLFPRKMKNLLQIFQYTNLYGEKVLNYYKNKPFFRKKKVFSVLTNMLDRKILKIDKCDVPNKSVMDVKTSHN